MSSTGVSPSHEQAAYGGIGWRARAQSPSAELGSVWAACGIDSECAPLRSVLPHRPGAELLASQRDPDTVQMLAPLDLAEHDAMAQGYRDNGATVHLLEHPGAPTPNQMFVADAFVMTPDGALARSAGRRVRSPGWACRSRAASAGEAALKAPT